MKVLSREELKAQLKRKQISPAYLLFGDESYLRDLAARHISNMVLRDSSLRDFNESEVSLNESDLRHAIGSAKQLPMMDEKRVVRVSNVSISANKQKNNIREEDEDLLKHYFKNAPETTVLIFVADELDKRLKMSRFLLERCVSVQFDKLEDEGLLKWAREKERELDVEFDEKALRHLVGLVGNDVRKLTLEIEKLVVAALPERVVSNELVEALVPNSRVLSNFDLTDKLLEGNRSGALETLRKILDDGAEPLMLLGLLSYNFRRLFLAKEMMNEGVDRSEVSKVMRLPYGKQQGFLETARRTDRARFEWILKRLAETDLAIKTSLATPRLQIEMLICELVNLPGD